MIYCFLCFTYDDDKNDDKNKNKFVIWAEKISFCATYNYNLCGDNNSSYVENKKEKIDFSMSLHGNGYNTKLKSD